MSFLLVLPELEYRRQHSDVTAIGRIDLVVLSLDRLYLPNENGQPHFSWRTALGGLPLVHAHGWKLATTPSLLLPTKALRGSRYAVAP